MIIQYKNQILIYCFNFFIQLFIFLCKNTNPIFLRSNLNIIVLFKFFTDNNFFFISPSLKIILFFLFSGKFIDYWGSIVFGKFWYTNKSENLKSLISSKFLKKLVLKTTKLSQQTFLWICCTLRNFILFIYKEHKVMQKLAVAIIT